MKSIDERQDIEKQVLESLLVEIGSGAYQPGDEVVSPEAVARKLVMNPRKIAAAYRRLEAEGILDFQKGGGYSVREGARTRIRAALLEGFQEKLLALISELERAGCTPSEIRESVGRILAARDRRGGEK